jgi:hypothetical protein
MDTDQVHDHAPTNDVAPGCTTATDVFYISRISSPSEPQRKVSYQLSGISSRGHNFYAVHLAYGKLRFHAGSGITLSSKAVVSDPVPSVFSTDAGELGV